MEVVGVTASIIGIIQLTGTVTKLCHEYLGRATGATKEMSLILNELYALKGVFEWLESQLKPNQGANTTPRTAMIQLLNLPNGPLERCRDTLRELGEMLQPPKLGRHIVWSFREKDVARLIGRLERDKLLFMLALHGDQITMSAQIERYCRTTLDKIHDLGIDQKRMANELEDTHRSVEHLSHAAKRQKTEDDITIKGKPSLYLIKSFQIRGVSSRTLVLGWLLKVNPLANHTAAQERWHRGTGSWFVEANDFQDWCDRGQALMWLQGIPGAGKTVLISAAIDKLNRLFPDRTSVGIAYFYFDFKEPAKQNARNMVLSLLGQLCRHHSTIPDYMHELYQKQLDHDPPSITDLTLALFDIVKTFKQIFLVIDALDECTERPALLGTLCTIIQHERGKHIKVLVASREEQNIRAAFSSLPLLSIRTQMSSDIRLYVTESIDTDTRLRSLPEEIKLEIKGTISEGAKGMFRWAECQLASIRWCRNIRAIQECLHTLPKDLDETYERILNGIAQNDFQLAHRALQWIAFSTMPMTVYQLAEAIVIEPDDAKTDEAARLFNPCEIIGICGSLVTTSQSTSGEGVDDPGHMSVGFAHYSVKEFLVSDRIKTSSARKFSLDQVDGSVYITTINLTYLTFERYKSKQFPRSLIHLPEHVLYAYAAEEWISHATDPAVQAQIVPNILQLLTPTQSNQLLTWQAVTYRSRESPLWTAIKKDFFLVAEELLTAGADPNALFQRETPLTFALRNQRKRGIEVLLRGGADPHAENIDGESPLSIALYHGPQCWLEAGGTPFAMAGRYDPLEDMADARNEIYTEFDRQDRGSTEDEQSALMILEKRIQCGVTTVSEKLMYDAAVAGWATFIAVLLQCGADPDMQHNGKTLLHGVMRALSDVVDYFSCFGDGYPTGGHVEQLLAVAMLLLENGGNLNKSECVNTGADAWRYSGLVTAVKCQHVGLVRELLKRGEDPNVPCLETGETALHTAVDMLWAVSYDLNSPDTMIVIAELLKGGADPNFRDYTGSTPFIKFFIYGYHNEETQKASVIIWVDYGANPEIRNNYGSNCWSRSNDEAHALLREALENKKNAIIG
ncbi:hypothetical protein Q9L58_005633 [Maublancomyces gigas]|uniref:Nephrocystin 3-like N-terminal domain-containing protein n=1 Tax=Discina gigas TaxID=1032678 RepID=A0ABR3GHY9_9PEZI